MAKVTYTKEGLEQSQSYGIVSQRAVKIEHELDQGQISTDKVTSKDRWACFTKVFPNGFKDELKALFHLAWPASLAALFSVLMSVVSLMFCGQLGTAELDAVGLAVSLINITGISIVYGLSTACDTLFSQAFGGDKKHLFGIYLQRSILVMSLAVVLCWGIHINTEGLLILLGQNRTVARLAGAYVLYYLPAVYFQCIYQILVRYLQNQNRILPTVWFGFVGNAANALAQYIGIYVLDGGIIGSALAQVLSLFVMLVTAIGYIFVTGIYKDSWGGWSIQALERWGEFTKLAVAGLVMTVTEWWCFEIGIFLNGLLGKVELGAATVLFQIGQLDYMVPFGFSVASSIRVGQGLGAGNAKASITTARTAQVFGSFLFVATLLMSLQRVLPLLFSTDQRVIDLVASIVPILVWLSFLDCIGSISMGTLRGCGSQWLGAAINFLGYILIGVPLGAVFLFVVHTGTSGIWWALVAGMSLADMIYFYIVMFRINWDEEVLKTQKRLSEKSAVKVDDDRSSLITTETSNGYGSGNGADVNHTSMDEKSVSRKRTRLIAKRLVTCFIVFGLLAAGVCVRLFVPLPSDPLIPYQNSTLPFINITMQYEL